jgi:DNA (cytosine-5)-methyltransferase 3A
MEDYQSDYPLTYVSLFSGIGGFEVGIHKIYPNARCLGYSEIDPNALKVYREHFPDHPALGDVTKADCRRLRGKVDLLVGGSPCQDFSALGSRDGLDGKKSGLFLHYLRILDEIRPRHFILENVVMKKEHQEALSDLLGVDPVLIDSNVISCQRRKRLYWCSFDVSAIAQLPKMDDCVGSILLSEREIGDYPLVYKDLKKDRTKSGRIMKDKINGRPNPRSSYYFIVQDNDETSPTVFSEQSHHFVHVRGSVYRNWHPIELERLQTFPDDWTSSLPKTRRYGALGNAVTCDVVALMISMME